MHTPNPPEPESPFLTMLASAPPDYLSNLEGAQRIEDLPPKYPKYFFFYGTLKDPATLKRILDLSEEPKLRPAKVIGYSVAKWGDYPALINGAQGEVVHGCACLVQSQEQVEKLAYYETKAYKQMPCWVRFTDNDDEASVKIPGYTFMYAGDEKALLEKRFDRKLWALQMGGDLPLPLREVKDKPQ